MQARSSIWIRGLGRERRHWGDLPARSEAQLQLKSVAAGLPGFGEQAQTRVPLSVEGLMRQLRARLRAQAEPPYLLVGHSLGGMVALSWARHFPDEVANLALVSSSAATLSAPWARLRPAAIRELLRCVNEVDARQREARILRLIAEDAAAHRAVLEDWTALAAQAPDGRRPLLRQLIAAARFRLEPSATNPLSRGLVLTGAQDRMVSPQCSLALAKTLGLPCYTHPRAGHDLFLDAPDWVLARLETLLAQGTQPALKRTA